eukprot:scaffold167823_cov23-Tisochrysis_lutea.AAC.1
MLWQLTEHCPFNSSCNTSVPCQLRTQESMQAHCEFPCCGSSRDFAPCSDGSLCLTSLVSLSNLRGAAKAQSPSGAMKAQSLSGAAKAQSPSDAMKAQCSGAEKAQPPRLATLGKHKYFNGVTPKVGF